MPDLGERANVMGPQPIMRRTPVPSAMIAAAERVLELLATRKPVELAALAMPQSASDVAEIAAAVHPGTYDHHEIITTARVKDHHFVKARLRGPHAAPFTFMFRLGEHDGRWMIWDAVNLTGRRGALSHQER
jgi:hypothetical protein